MKFLILTATLAMSLLLGGCSIHHLEIQQGVIMQATDIAKLKTGMRDDQVIFLLGEPPIRDPFHPDRWDYIYSLQSADGKTSRQHLTLFFNEETLVRIVSQQP